MRVSLAQAQELQGELQYSAYACLDTTGTREIFDTLRPRLNPDQERIYAWNRAQQSPAIAMGLRGIRVDEEARKRAHKRVAGEAERVTLLLQEHPLVAPIWDGVELETGFCPAGGLTKSGKKQRHQWPRAPKGEGPIPPAGMKCLRCGCDRQRPVPFSPSSPVQCAHLLYDLLKVPRQFNRDGGVTTDDEALQKIEREGRVYGKDGRRHKLPGLPELTRLLLTIRDFDKQRGFLEARLSNRGRFHSSFNVAAAWTGRQSSSKDPFQRGGNLQNVAEQHRSIFIADPGRELFYSDLKTAESLKVAYLSGEERYIKAHEGDVHTYVCRELWPDVAWTGDIKKDKKIASSIIPEWDNAPGHDLRFQSKRVQHGSNYGLTPFGMAIIAHIPVAQAARAQKRYFEAFPGIREWQDWTRERVEASLPLYNALRRVVFLFGRPWDGHTLKQGLAFGPQSGIADVLNLGLWRVWRECDPHLIELLAQVHDAILGQYPIERRGEALEALQKLMRVEVPVTDIKGVTRTMVIPSEIAVGQNWGKRSDDNPQGMKEAA